MNTSSPTTSGLIPRDSPWAEVREVVCATWGRVLQASVCGGWRIDILVDRGLDIGPASYRDTPVAWRSPIANDPGSGHSWENRFLGGLLATCGTENIGAAHNDLPMHGSHHHTTAAAVTSEVLWSGDAASIRATGRVESTSLAGRRVVVNRTITIDGDRITVQDEVLNLGHRAETVALLYHVNLGYPLVAPGTRIHPGAAAHAIADNGNPPEADAWVVPALSDSGDAAVFELVAADQAPLSRVAVVRPGAAMLEIAWSSETLPRLNEWMWPRRGINVLAIEPSNAPLFGGDRRHPRAGAPALAPGDRLAASVSIRYAHADDESDGTS